MQEINHEYYVSLEVAKLLKEAGFDWEICDGYLVHEDGDVSTTGFQIPYDFNGDNGDLFINHNGHKESFSRPTLEVAQRWLREVKNCSVIIDIFVHNLDKNNIYYTYNWIVYFNGDRYSGSDCNTTRYYEVAQEAGIKKALEICRYLNNVK